MDIKIINCLRNLGIDMINNRGEGDAGLTLSLAPTIYTIFNKHLNFCVSDPKWINRDRFIMSDAGGSALLYSTLFYSGYKISLDEIKKYGRINSKLPVYSEYNPNIGIETTSGKNAEGLGVAVGIAYGQKYLKQILGSELINNKTYVMVTDEDMLHSAAYEVLTFAAKEKLKDLIIIYNSFETNKDGKKENNNILKIYEAAGFSIETVTNAEDYINIDKAISKAKQSDKPSIIEIKTIIGIGTSLQNNSKSHDEILNDKDYELVKEKMNITKVPFHISASGIEEFKNNIENRTNNIYNEWVTRYNYIIENDEYKKNLISLLEDNNLKLNIKNLKISFDPDMKEDLRVTNNNLMNALCEMSQLIIGGSIADDKTTKTILNNDERNIKFGLRPLGSSYIANGLALCGLYPYVSTTLKNAGLLKAGIRLSCVMKNNVTYIFVDDSIVSSYQNKLVEPIEDLSILRMIPGLNTFRPADVNELVGSWDCILNKDASSALVLTSADKGLLKNSNIKSVQDGAYIISKEKGRLNGVLVSTGSEIELTLRLQEELESKGIYTRVVSIPVLSFFEKQSKEYKEELMPIGAKVVVIELSNDNTWNKLVYNEKYILNIKDYVDSGVSKDMISSIGFNIESLIEKVEKLLK